MQYLKEHKRVTYTMLLTSGNLNIYLADVDEQAQNRFERLMEQMKQAEELTEQLKIENPMLWVGIIDEIQSRALEIVNAEIIYI